MTNEEAISWLEHHFDPLPDGTKQSEAVSLAIKALEQKSCEDWHDVSSDEMTLEQARQAVKDLRKKLAEYLEQESKTDTWSIKDVADTLAKHGLIVEQEPCEDAISRQAVTEIINDIRDCISVEGYCAILERMKKLPSVNPQEPKTGHWIIYDVHGHKACKCSECDKDAGYPCNDKYCPKCGCLMIKPQESEDKE